MESQSKKPHGNTGRKCSETKKAAIRARLLGRKTGPYPPERGRAISAAKKGKPATEAQLRALALAVEANRGKPCRNRERLLGRTLTDEHKAKISAGLRGRKHSDETKAKISKIQKGRQRSDAEKEFHRKQMLAFHASGRFKAWRSKVEMRVGWLVELLGFTQQFRLGFGKHPYDYGNRESRVLIEVNGCYWHSHGCLKKDTGEAIKTKDAQHAQAAADAGYKLLVLWQCQEAEWPLILKREGVY